MLDNKPARYVASWWHIPNGADYHNATPCFMEFSTEYEAECFLEDMGLNNIPEMGMVTPKEPQNV